MEVARVTEHPGPSTRSGQTFATTQATTMQSDLTYRRRKHNAQFTIELIYFVVELFYFDVEYEILYFNVEPRFKNQWLNAS